MSMFTYPSMQLYTVDPHYLPQHQIVYAQQHQQQADTLMNPYNQLYSILATYPNSAFSPVKYMQQQATEGRQQTYQTDQLVPFPSLPKRTSVDRGQIQNSSLISTILTSSPNTSDITTTPAKFPPIIRTNYSTKLDIVSHDNPNLRSNGSSSSTPIEYESLKLNNHYQSESQLSLKIQHQRSQIDSESSCDESDSTIEDNSQFEWHPENPKTLMKMALVSKKCSYLTSSTDFPNSKRHFPVINSTAASNMNQNSSIKNHSNFLMSQPKLIQYIYKNIIGKDYIFQGPWGLRRMFYCDYTASGRPLQFIEDYIKTHVLPLYGNTHSETSLCAQQSTKFREEARNIIKKSVNANENDILLFVGAGSTGAVHALVENFDLHNENIRCNTVVIISSFEHHSNILPWQETGVEMVRIPTTQQGILDKAVLEKHLSYFSKLNKRILCSLNAASNITGILTDVDSISTLAHSYSAFVFWDYATAAPYVEIDMNSSATAYKDAIFISTHKFVGGPGSPGILIAKKNLFSLKPPRTCGGGTVNFVTRTCHEYNYNIEIREEGGTPDIIGCIRAGLVFQLKDSIDMNYMQMRKDQLVKQFYRRFEKIETLILLGSKTVARLPIFSFIIYVPSICKYLHHNFVCLLLNDLFGIQVRSGCACAGPYALDLLNIDDAKTDIYCMFMTEDACARDDQIVRTMMMKPGFTRLNLSLFANNNEIDYVLDAIQFIANEGWKFLPLYTYDLVTARWQHRSDFQLVRPSLQSVTYKSGKMQYYINTKDRLFSCEEKSLKDPFREAKSIATDAIHRAIDIIDYSSDPPLNIPDKYKHMIWFGLPSDIVSMIHKQRETKQEIKCNIDCIPFIPLDAKERIVNSTKTNTLSKCNDNRKKHYSNHISSSSFRILS